MNGVTSKYQKFEEEKRRIPLKVEQEGLKEKNVIERLFSSIESFKKVFS